jgi:hypothetical protein
MSQKKMLNRIFLVGLMSTAPTLAAAAPIVFNDFSDASALQLHVNAAITNDNVLRLVPAAADQLGAAFLKSPVVLGPGMSFSSVFQFRISNSGGISDADGPGGDGFVFVAQGQGSNIYGSNYSGGMGYSGIPHSLGIEFDTWNNMLTGSNTDANDGNHLGLDLNGSLYSAVQVNLPTGAGNADRLNNGNIWTAWVDYNGATHFLDVRLAQGTNATRPDAPLLSYSLDLASTLGTTSPYFGFTSGSGGAFGNHDILSWRLDPLAVPLPAAVWLFGSGLLGLLGVVARRKQAA